MKRFVALLLLLALPANALGPQFVTNANIFSGEVASNLTTGAPLVVSSTGKVTTGINFFQVTVAAASTSTTTSTANPSTAVITSMTQTPAAGVWKVDFCSTFEGSANNIKVVYSIYVGGTLLVEHSLTPTIQGGVTPTLAMDMVGCATGIATVNGSQAIEIRWHASVAGTLTALGRNITGVRLQ